MRDFRHIHKHLDTDTVTTLAKALVSSRLDYCNSLLYAFHNRKLQHIQNAITRIVTNSNHYTRASQLLEQLHWLLVQSNNSF